MGFFGRFGNSCGAPFSKKDFCDKHIQYENFCPYLKDRPSQPWTYFTTAQTNSHDKIKTKSTRISRTKNNKTINKKTINNKTNNNKTKKHKK
jgi:hypothetical protein